MTGPIWSCDLTGDFNTEQDGAAQSGDESLSKKSFGGTGNLEQVPGSQQFRRRAVLCRKSLWKESSSLLPLLKIL